MSTRNVHVGASGRNGWYVIHGGRRMTRHRTQGEAISIGRGLARRHRVDLVIHGRTGRIRSKDSYGNESGRRDTEH